MQLAGHVGCLFSKQRPWTTVPDVEIVALVSKKETWTKHGCTHIIPETSEPPADTEDILCS